MKRKNSGSVRVWSVFGKVGLLVFLAAAAIDGSGRAVADAPGSQVPPPPEDPIDPWDGHLPNTLYPDEPEAVLITEVSQDEQAGIAAMGERSDYGEAVRGAWSSATHAIAADAAVQRAAHQSGTTGLEDVGVEP